MSEKNILIILALVFSLGTGVLHAGVATDGSTGVQQVLGGPDFRIPSTLGTQRGGNLFHSFSEFSIFKGQSATFTGQGGISNIFSRVTGGSVSTIDGLLRSDISGANLYFLNPAGVVFGPNAQLDVSGSLHVSTADYLRFADGAKFHTSFSQPSLLSVAAPEAFGFLGSNPGGISFQGSGSDYSVASLGYRGFSLPQGKELSLSGGKIALTSGTLDGVGEVESRVKASGGRINIAAVASPGEAVVGADGFDAGSFSGMGTLELSKGSSLSVSSSVGSAGKIDVKAGGMTIDSAGMGQKTSGYSGLYATTGSASGGGGSISATLTGDAKLSNYGTIFASNSGSSASGAKIYISADNVNLLDGGNISCLKSGNAGAMDVRVTAARGVTITGVKGNFPSGIYLSNGGSGEGGSLSLSAASTVISSGGVIFSETNGVSGGGGANVSIGTGSLNVNSNGGVRLETSSAGQGGRLEVVAQGGVDIDAGGGIATGFLTTSKGSGKAGDISVSAETVMVSNSGYISSLANSTGNGGAINIISSGDILITGQNTSVESMTGLFDGATGNSGTITIITPATMTLSKGAGIYTTAGSSSVTTPSAARGGDVLIRAGKFEILNGDSLGTRISASSYTSGKAGDMSITATEGVLLDGGKGLMTGADIAANNYYSTQPNRIYIQAPSVILTHHGAVTTVTITGSGGSIVLNTDYFEMTGGIITSGTSSSGTPGSVTVNSPRIYLAANKDVQSSFDKASQIDALTHGSGQGGTITLNSNVLEIGAGGRVFSGAYSSGKGGTINIVSDEIYINGGGYVSSSSQGTGDAGRISAKAPSRLEINGADSGFYCVTLGSGKGGDLYVSSGDTLISSGGRISAESAGSGRAGSVTANAGNLKLENSSITAETKNSDGGNLFINVPGQMLLVNSSATATARGGTGDGGNINLSAQCLVLDPSRIIAQADYGNGGNIRIQAEAMMVTKDSLISASSNYGVTGVVRISPPTIDIGSNIVQMNNSFLDASALMPKSCVTRDPAAQGAFVIRGASGLPPAPDGRLSRE